MLLTDQKEEIGLVYKFPRCFVLPQQNFHGKSCPQTFSAWIWRTFALSGWIFRTAVWFWENHTGKSPQTSCRNSEIQNSKFSNSNTTFHQNFLKLRYLCDLQSPFSLFKPFLKWVIYGKFRRSRQSSNVELRRAPWYQNKFYRNFGGTKFERRRSLTG